MQSIYFPALSKTASRPRGAKSFAILLAAAASVPALFAGASNAIAADLSYKDDRPAIVSYSSGSWAGAYFGAQAGAAVGNDRDNTIFSSGSSAGGAGGGGGAGAGGVGGTGGTGGDAFSVFSTPEGNGDTLVGVHVGYNWQNANLVYGLEADLDANNAMDDLLGSVRARVGYGSDRTLFYLTAGLAYISVDGASSVFARGAGGNGGDGGDAVGAPGGPGGAGGTGQGIARVNQDTESGFGVVAGIGVEHKITNQIGIGLEGLYYAFGDDNVGLSNDGDFFTIQARLTMHLDRDSNSLKDGYPALADWRGAYLGGHLGALLSDDIISSTAANGGNGGGGGSNGVGDAGGGGGGGGGGGTAVANLGSDTSLLGGVHAGYNWQNGSLVYGFEGDASFSDNDQISYLASARARVGYATGSYLFYGTAGVAFAGLDRITGISANNGQNGQDGGNAPNGAGGNGGNGGNANSGSLKNEEDAVGFVVGAGVDAKLTDRLSLGLEGLYYGFDGDAKATSGDNAFNSDDADVFVLRSRLSYSLTPHVEPLK